MLKRAYIIVCLLIILIPAFVFAGQFKVTRVIDGDTLVASGHDIEIKVRLVGIDAPEMSRKKNESGQPFSRKSKEFLSGMVLNKSVDIQGYGIDRYGRQLAVVYVDGKNVNLELVKSGLAEVYRGKAPRSFNAMPYRKAENVAKKEVKGIWSLCPNMNISPKEWRKNNK
jgi:endonuclease YncB( thermonuclease family)